MFNIAVHLGNLRTAAQLLFIIVSVYIQFREHGM